MLNFRSKTLASKEEFSQRIIPLLQTNILGQSPHPIKVKSTAFLAKIVRYSMRNQREDIIEFFNNKVMSSKSNFIRKYYLVFIEKLHHYLSVSFICDNNLIVGLLKFSDDNSSMQTKLIAIIKNFYLLVKDDTKIKNLIISNIEKMKKNKHDKELLKVNT